MVEEKEQIIREIYDPSSLPLGDSYKIIPQVLENLIYIDNTTNI